MRAMSAAIASKAVSIQNNSSIRKIITIQYSIYTKHISIISPWEMVSLHLQANTTNIKAFTIISVPA